MTTIKDLIITMVFFGVIISAVIGTAIHTRSLGVDEETSNYSDSCFVEIKGTDYENLYYYKDTRVIYIMYANDTLDGFSSYGEGYMAPYISENGKYCRYINDVITEIE
jgi:hypothetical protein